MFYILGGIHPLSPATGITPATIPLIIWFYAPSIKAVYLLRLQIIAVILLFI